MHLRCFDCTKKIQPGREYIHYAPAPEMEKTGIVFPVPMCRECNDRFKAERLKEYPNLTRLHSLDEKQIGRYVLNLLAFSWQAGHKNIAYTLRDYGSFDEDAPAELRFVRDLFADGNPKSLVDKWTDGNPLEWLDRAEIDLEGDDQ